MAIKYLSSINLSKNELQNAAIQNLASAPSGAVLGQIYFNTTDNEIYVCVNATNQTWESLGGDIEEVIAGGGLTGGGADGSVTLDVGAGTGITVNANDVQIKNAGNLTNNTVSKWDSTNGQFVNSSITDDGTTVTIGANLTVTGTTTYVNSNTVEIGDAILLLNRDETGTPSQNAGFEVERGTATNVSFIWNEESQYFSTIDQKFHIGSIADITAANTNQVLVSDSGVVKKVDASDILDLITISAETGSAAPSTGDFTIAAGEGINTVGSGSTITISGEDASDTNKGIASFASADFDVTTGAVSLEDTVVKTVTTDSGALTPSGHGFSILGGEGMNVTHTSTTITVDGEDASETNKGIVELATNAEAVTGTDTVRAVTPAGVEAHYASKGYAADITAAASVTVTHNLGSRDVAVQLRETASPYAYVFTDTEATTTNTVTLRFGASVGTTFRVMIQRID
jgi:hypothetical protein